MPADSLLALLQSPPPKQPVSKNNVVSAIKKAHPYDEVAYDIYPLLNEHEYIGMGMVGELNEAIEELKEMRAYEGEEMIKDLLLRVDNITRSVDEIESCNPGTIQEYFNKLKMHQSKKKISDNVCILAQ